MKHLTLLKFLFLSLLLIFLSCLINPDNPVDPEYKGDYNILLKNSTQVTDSVLEILYPYSVTIENLGLDRFWMIFLSGSSSDNSNKLDSFCSFDTLLDSDFNSTDSATYSFYFTKPFTGLLYLTGIKPNHDSVKIPLFSSSGSVKVINPYSISGKTIAGLDEAVVLSLKYKNSTVPSTPFFDSIYWKNESSNIARVKKINDTFLFLTPSSPDVQSEFLSSLFYGDATGSKNSVSLPVFRITTISGSSPVISAFDVRSGHALTLGEKAQFAVKVNDLDTNFLRFIILATGSKGNDTLFSSKYSDVETDTFYIETDSILKDTGYKSVSLFVYDQDSLYNSSTLQVSEKGGIIHKKVTIDIDGKVFEPPVGINSVITVSSDADEFFWIYHGSVTATDSNSFALPAYSNTTTDTISVFARKFYIFGNDTAFTFTSDTVRIVITPTSYNYRIHTLSGFPDTVKVRNTYTLSAGVFSIENVQVHDSNLTYKWKFSDTSVVVIDSSVNSSRTIICKDSIANSIRVTIKATFKNATSTIQDSVKNIYIRSYRPYFKFAPLTDTILSSIYNTFSYTAHDSSNNGVVTKILFRQIFPVSGEFDSINYGSPLSMKFNGAGKCIIIGQARDTENMLSKADTLRFRINISIPQFKDTLITDTVSLGKLNTISVDTLVAGQVSKYIWNFGSYNGLAQCTTTVDSVPVPFMKEGICTTTVQCCNSDGLLSVKPLRMILHVLKIPPVLKIALTQSDTVYYIQKPLVFNLSATDNDSDLDSVYFVARRAGLTDSIIVKVKAALGNKATYKPQFTPASSGVHTFYMTATDKSGNRKTDSLNLTIDSGIPVVDSISCNKTPVYVKTAYTFTVYGHDNDTSLITYSIAFDDSVNGFEPFKETNTFSHSFKSAGMHYVYSRLKDAPGQLSPIKKDSVYVRLGKPVITATFNYISPESDYFVNDSILVTLNFNDSNGTVENVYLDNISDAIPPKKGTVVPSGSKTYTFGYRLPVNAPDTINFSIWCTDNDTISSDTSTSQLQVRKAAPAFTGISTNSCWVVDTTYFTFSCADTNGNVKKMNINWGDGTFDSTLGNSITSQTYKKAYANLSTRPYKVIVTLTDDDSLVTVDTQTVTVDQGLPGVAPLIGSGDTIYAPLKEGSSTVAILNLSATDLHGQIVKYYWQLQNDNNIDSTTVPVKEIGTLPALVNKYVSDVYVSVRDDAGSIVTDTFHIFVDGAPTAPDTVSPYFGEPVNKQTVKLVWKNSDPVDGNKTEFAILYTTSGSSPTDTLSTFKAGSAYASEGTDIYSYTFDASALPSGIFSWQIIARDRVGNISKSPVSQFVLQ